MPRLVWVLEPTAEQDTGSALRVRRKAEWNRLIRFLSRERIGSWWSPGVDMKGLNTALLGLEASEGKFFQAIKIHSIVVIVSIFLM